MAISLPSLLLAAWVPASLLLFRLLGPRWGPLACLLGGWALLPTGDYPAEMIAAGAEREGWAQAVCIAAPPLWNKASAIGLGCLLGLALLDGPALRRLRPGWIDGLMLVLAGAPVASAWANGLPLAGGLAQARHLALGWGVPYLVGRCRFADSAALLDLGRAWALAGLATAPIALVDLVRGPIAYRLLYGAHPYRFDGSDRWLVHRPLGLLEHGNQWGMWSASAALAAAWLWATGTREIGRAGGLAIGTGPAAVLLAALCLAGQSHGAIVLLGAGLAPLVLLRLGAPLKGVVGALVALIGLAGTALGLLVARSGGLAGFRGVARGYFHGMGKSSFTWRLARWEENIGRLGARPLLGWGRPDWSAASPDGRLLDPVALSYFLVETGFHGLIGSLAGLGVLATPVARGLAGLRRADWGKAPASGPALACALLAINLADLFLNSALILPVLVAAGGLAAWAPGPADLAPPAGPAWERIGLRFKG